MGFKLQAFSFMLQGFGVGIWGLGRVPFRLLVRLAATSRDLNDYALDPVQGLGFGGFGFSLGVQGGFMGFRGLGV